MAGKNILLVEDNPVNRRLAVFLLRSQGYEVREATTAQEALDLLEKERSDLINEHYPGCNGLILFGALSLGKGSENRTCFLRQQRFPGHPLAPYTDRSQPT